MSIIAKYKFNSTLYTDLIPEFNSEFTDYTVTDDTTTETDSEGNVIVTRTIESDSLPTLMRFGSNLDTYVEGNELALLEILDMNTGGLTSCSNMFRCCKNLADITCEWDTSNVTSMSAMFSDCQSLTTLDLSNFDTSKVTNMSYMFNSCTKLTTLDVSNFNTDNVTNMSYMFQHCTNLTSLDLSNWDTSKVAAMNRMFSYCIKLTTLNLSNFNTSNVTNMYAMLRDCTNLTTLDVSNFNTSKVTNMSYTFYNCKNLTSLDLSNFNISNVTDIYRMLDAIFLLTDIGMIYCDQSTINKVASVLPTDITQTIWVEDVDVKDLTPVENVEFKQYAKNTEVMLTSPLLEGDKLIVKDGKLYHYHKMGMVVLDGSEDWAKTGTTSNNSNYTNYFINVSDISLSPNMYCDKIKPRFYEENKTSIGMDCEDFLIGGYTLFNQIRICTTMFSINELKQWLNSNPTTVVYELASPYYELISDKPLDIPVISETVDITNSSNIPLNMTISNSGMSTIAMKPSTTYTVAFDKKSEGDLTVNLCGNEVTTTDNIVEITTPSEIDDELIFYGDGIEISNVRLLEGSVSGDSIPRETFEGLKNSFEDGYIPENLTNINEQLPFNVTFDYDTKARNILKITNFIFKPNTTYTVKIDGTNSIEGTFMVTTDSGEGGGMNIKPSSLPLIEKITTNNKVGNLWIYWTTDCGSSRSCTIDSISILEGDWTHLTEEDWNNLGKYKVEYKVTGKNKFDKDNLQLDTWYGNDGIVRKDVGTTCACNIKVKPNTDYTVTCINLNRCEVWHYDREGKFLAKTFSYSIKGNSFTLTTLDNTYTINIKVSYYEGNSSLVSDIQVEEGIVATEYEPYKEYTKTFYLNSPLLEGDTIEDVNGVATHVKRYGKVVLDGSETWWSGSNANANGITYMATTSLFNIGIDNRKLLCDSLRVNEGNNQEHFTDYNEILAHKSASYSNACYISTQLSQSDFTNSLQQNPVTVVYQLDSPIYEPISDESILCDSYVNGHLDFDSAVPIERVGFKGRGINLNYINTNTNYTIQFESDDVGKLDVIALADINSKSQIDIAKGINKININTTSSNIPFLWLNGIGFNASNIQVVATDKDFDYFEGLQSSFEENLVTDETDENYGKYKVECIVTNEDNSEIYTKTIYLNSPLLKGDTIEVHNGKLCHYHKMGMVVFDGSEVWENATSTYVKGYRLCYQLMDAKEKGFLIVDRFRVVEHILGGDTTVHFFENTMSLHTHSNLLYVHTKLALNDFKQWLQANPTTIVYELAEPYYEKIEPTQEDLIITSIKEGDLHIDTIVPISSKVTYNVNVQLLTDFEQSIVEQVQATQTTDLQSILDEEIDN